MAVYGADGYTHHVEEELEGAFMTAHRHGQVAPLPKLLVRGSAKYEEMIKQLRWLVREGVTEAMFRKSHYDGHLYDTVMSDVFPQVVII